MDSPDVERAREIHALWDRLAGPELDDILRFEVEYRILDANVNRVRDKKVRDLAILQYRDCKEALVNSDRNINELNERAWTDMLHTTQKLLLVQKIILDRLTGRWEALIELMREVINS